MGADEDALKSTVDPILRDALAKKAIAEAAQAEAETRRALAETKKAQAEARKFAAEARKTNTEANTAERDEREKLVDWRFQHIYPFAAGQNESSVRQCMNVLNVWDQLDPKCPIEIVLTSGGGEVIWGMVLFDYLRLLSDKGHKIITSTWGYAASMAGILLQAGDERVMYKQAWIMIHELTASTGGKIGEIDDTVAWYHRLGDHVIDIFVERSNGKLRRDYFIDHWTRREWWLDANEALALGMIDIIR